MRKRLAVIGIVTLVPLTSMQPAVAAESQQSPAFLGSLVSRIVERVTSFFGAGQQDTQGQSVQLHEAAVGEDEQYVGFACPDSLLPYFPSGLGPDFPAPECYGPVDSLDTIQALAAQGQVPAITEPSAVAETLSFKCPDILPAGTPHTGLSDAGYCWDPEIASGEKQPQVSLDAVQQHHKTATDGFIAVPCDGTPILSGVEGQKVYAGNGMCVAESEVLATA